MGTEKESLVYTITEAARLHALLDDGLPTSQPQPQFRPTRARKDG